jgi:hypothetical protein
MVQEAVWSCEGAESSNEHPPKLGAIVKTASLLADANGITTFETGEDSARAIELLEALAIPAPVEFMAKFKREFSALQTVS